MKEILRTIILILSILLLAGTSLLPIIVSIITGNWWYILLYSVIWILLMIEITIIRGIFTVIDY